MQRLTLPMSSRVRRALGVLCGIGLLVMLAFTTHQAWMPSLYHYLDVSQPPQRADVIVVLGGSDGWRERAALELYRQGYAPHLLISGGGNMMQLALEPVREANIPPSALTVNDRATNTYTEAQQNVDILRRMGARSALIITDAWHTRRAQATYQQVAGDRSITFSFSASPPDYDPERWWQVAERQYVYAEFPKMAYYFLAYGIWAW